MHVPVSLKTRSTEIVASYLAERSKILHHYIHDWNLCRLLTVSVCMCEFTLCIQTDITAGRFMSYIQVGKNLLLSVTIPRNTTSIGLHILGETVNLQLIC